MNDLLLMRKNLFRKPVRTTLLIISILIAFLIFSVMISFTHAISTFNAHAAWALAATTTEDCMTEGQPLMRWDNHTGNGYVYSGAGYLADIAATSKTTFWAVGARRIKTDHPLLVHSDGHSIRVAHTSLGSLPGTTLDSLSALSPTDIWAAGRHLLAHYSR